MRITVLGAGPVGRAVAYRALIGGIFDQVVIVDIDDKRLGLARKLCGEGVITVRADVLKELDMVIRGSDVVSCTLPGSISFGVCRDVLKMGISVVDSAYMPQDPFLLDDIARDHDVVYVPDAGFAPGVSNILVGYLSSKLRSVDRVEIYVGGLPIRPEEPFFHSVNWSISDFVEEYLRPARIIRDGRVISVNPLEKIGRVTIRGIEYEWFYTDGLRTLLRTVRARDMSEKTLRYPRHLERMRFLRDIGLLSNDRIEIGGNRISCKEIVVAVLRRTMYKPDMRDRLVLYVIVEGDGKKFEAYMEEEYDTSIGLSAMAKATGFTNAILSEMVVDVIHDRGVFPPEYFGMRYMDYFMDKISRHIKVDITQGSG